jgi:hypothetical protein
MAALPSDEHRTVALMRMQGHSVEEVAAALGVVDRIVKRKLEIIRAVWERVLAEQDAD